MYIKLLLLLVIIFFFERYFKLKRDKKLAIVKQKAIKLNEEVLSRIELITQIDQKTDDEILHLIMSAQEFNMARFAKAKAPMKYIDWQFNETQNAMDIYFQKIESIINLSQEK